MKNIIDNKEIQNKKDLYKIDSKILTKKEEIDFISNRIKEMKYFNNKNIFYEFFSEQQKTVEIQLLFMENVMEYPKLLQ